MPRNTISRDVWDSLGTGLIANEEEYPATLYDALTLSDSILGVSPAEIGFNSPTWISNLPDGTGSRASYGVGQPADSLVNSQYSIGKLNSSEALAPSFGHEMFHHVSAMIPMMEGNKVTQVTPEEFEAAQENQEYGYSYAKPYNESAYVKDLANRDWMEMRGDIYNTTMSNINANPELSEAYAKHVSTVLTDPSAVDYAQAVGQINPENKDYVHYPDEMLARSFGDYSKYWIDPDYDETDPNYGLSDKTYDTTDELLYQLGEASNSFNAEKVVEEPSFFDFFQSKEVTPLVSNADNLDIRSDYRDLGWSEEKINEHLASTFGIPSPYFDEPVETDVAKDMTKVEAFSPKDEEGILGDLSARDLMSYAISLSPVGNVYTAMETAKGLAGEAEGNWLSDAIKEGYGNLNSWYGGIIGEPSGSGLFGESLDSGSYTDMGDYSYGTIDGIGVEDPY